MINLTVLNEALDGETLEWIMEHPDCEGRGFHPLKADGKTWATPYDEEEDAWVEQTFYTYYYGTIRLDPNVVTSATTMARAYETSGRNMVRVVIADMRRWADQMEERLG